MVSRLIAEMIESGLLSRRGKQYVLLQKWDFDDNRRNSKKFSPRFEAASSGRSSTRVVASGSTQIAKSRHTLQEAPHEQLSRALPRQLTARRTMSERLGSRV
jgi:hypothetical protein